MLVSSVRPDKSIKTVLVFDGKSEVSVSRTKQQFKDECDINKILKRYKRTGTVPTNGMTPIFGDFTSGLDFQVLLNKVAKAKEVFEALPLDVRKELDFDPAKLVDFALDDTNYERAVKLGLRLRDEAKEKAISDKIKLESEEKVRLADEEFARRVRKAMSAEAPKEASGS